MAIEPNITVYRDWEAIQDCTYPVPAMTAQGEEDCREPALYRVWWWVDDGPGQRGEIHVCQEHFNKIMEAE